MTEPEVEKRWKRGETVPIEVHVEVWSFDTDEWIDADCNAGYPKLTLFDPNGLTIVDAATVSAKESTGHYYYPYLTTTNSPVGLWRHAALIQVTSAITGGYLYKISAGGFWLE